MQIKQYQLTKVVIAVLTMPSLFLTGCATIGGAPHYTQNLPPDARIVAVDTVNTEVSAPASVPIANYEMERLAQQITSKIRSCASQGSREGRNYRIAVHITQYEKGSAMARAMLAGLGQMHIDGAVSVYATPGQAKIGEFTISKTFSWGGLYGACTTIETVEEEFAKAVADAVTAKSTR